MLGICLALDSRAVRGRGNRWIVREIQAKDRKRQRRRRHMLDVEDWKEVDVYVMHHACIPYQEQLLAQLMAVIFRFTPYS